MAYTVPDGSKVFLSTGLDAAKAITELTNAKPAVATVAAHGLQAGAELVLLGGWENASNRVFRVGANPAAGSLSLAGLDTTSLQLYPVGGGLGVIRPITGWIEIQQVLNPSSSGGEQQFANVDPLASQFQLQIPTGKTAVSLTLPIADDPTLPGYQAWQNAADNRAFAALKFVKPSGETNYFFGLPSINNVPSMAKGSVATVTATFSPQGLITRYPAVAA